MVLSPAWSTDWITLEGREALEGFGIAPPSAPAHQTLLSMPTSIRCPRRGSTNTRVVSAYGSTACKDHRVCEECREPFDHFRTLR